MLSDFLILELYYGHDEALRPMGDLLDHYNAAHIEEAILNGDLLCYTASLGPDQGTLYYRLSEQGREKAEDMLKNAHSDQSDSEYTQRKATSENPLYVAP